MLKPLDVRENAETVSDAELVNEVIELLVAQYRENLRGQGGLLSTGQAADLLGTSCATVKRWCDAGKLECAKTPGGHRKIHMWSLAHVLEEHPHPDTVVPYVLTKEPVIVHGVDLAHPKSTDLSFESTFLVYPDGTKKLVEVREILPTKDEEAKP